MSEQSDSKTLENLSTETRRFPPSEEIAAGAVATADLYDEAAKDRLAFWAKQARDLITWSTDFTDTLDWSDAPFAHWFVGGELNVAYNCVDRHVENGLGDRVAIHFEGEPGDSRSITYAELQAEVSRAANALTDLGVQSGDRVAIYLPMIPEAVVSMLACARIGAPHSVVFGGFSADASAIASCHQTSRPGWKAACASAPIRRTTTTFWTVGASCSASSAACLSRTTPPRR